jgi:hypothetical protein
VERSVGISPTAGVKKPHAFGAKPPGPGTLDKFLVKGLDPHHRCRIIDTDLNPRLLETLVPSFDSATKTLVLRQSDVFTFKECPRRSWLGTMRNFERLEEHPNKSHIGTAYHAGIAAWYATRNPDIAVGAVNAQMAIWESDGIVIEDDRLEWDKTIEQARIMVEGYIEWVQESGEDHGLTFMLIERRVKKYLGEFSGIKVYISGQVDISLVTELGIKKLVDNKSKGDLKVNRLLGIDDQLFTYDWLLDYEYAYGVHNMAKRSKRTARATPPFFARTEIKFTDAKRAAFMAQLNGTVQRLVDTYLALEVEPRLHFNLAPPTPTKDCDWKCPFIDVCPMYNEGDDAEGYLNVNFKQKADVDG